MVGSARDNASPLPQFTVDTYRMSAGEITPFNIRVFCTECVKPTSKQVDWRDSVGSATTARAVPAADEPASPPAASLAMLPEQ